MKKIEKRQLTSVRLSTHVRMSTLEYKRGNSHCAPEKRTDRSIHSSMSLEESIGNAGAYLKLSASRPSRYLMAELTKVAGKAMANHRASIKPKPRTSRKTILFTIWPSSSATYIDRKVLVSNVNVAHASRPVSRVRHPGTIIFNNIISCRKKSRSNPTDNLSFPPPFPAELLSGDLFWRTLLFLLFLEWDWWLFFGVVGLKRVRMCG